MCEALSYAKSVGSRHVCRLRNVLFAAITIGKKGLEIKVSTNVRYLRKLRGLSRLLL